MEGLHEHLKEQLVIAFHDSTLTGESGTPSAPVEPTIDATPMTVAALTAAAILTYSMIRRLVRRRT
jgi:hypothetical protein